jgi:protoheme IX farnesyltransferase
VTGALALPAWVLFLIVFYWTPPHFWALAIRYRDDYERAGVPMLPVVAGVEATTRKMLLYTGLMVAISLLLVPVAGMRWIYLTAAIGLGTWFLWDTWRVYRRPEEAMRLFTTSTSPPCLRRWPSTSWCDEESLARDYRPRFPAGRLWVG